MAVALTAMPPLLLSLFGTDLTPARVYKPHRACPIRTTRPCLDKGFAGQVQTATTGIPSISATALYACQYGAWDCGMSIHLLTTAPGQ
ncbi:hypothetical protein GMORB2_0026 [Geosmithia morbida]|uniref:Secreted protein n=1 Tax=Geosmithia morbida TaxID=1094350 RepID=A0A9P5D805_9HYPO|nr:uncharacterized protein GMORB2_0026 [Geosmithia morbida]KAF4126290.1 hypothetical protein GMORB2_0026 [Geosmithia morbida]